MAEAGAANAAALRHRVGTRSPGSDTTKVNWRLTNYGKRKRALVSNHELPEFRKGMKILLPARGGPQAELALDFRKTLWRRWEHR